MTDSPPRPRSPLRWILLGCAGVAALGLLAAGGCVGVMYYIYRSSDPIARAGADYLKAAPQVQDAFGAPLTIERRPMNWQVKIHNDEGTARMGYSVVGPKGTGYATVWLRRPSGGAWAADGARMQAPGTDAAIELGRPHPSFGEIIESFK